VVAAAGHDGDLQRIADDRHHMSESPGPPPRPLPGPAEPREQQRQQRREERRRLLASGPPSPCISVCRLSDATGWCEGCFRTIDEIRDWIILTPDERRAVLARVAERRAGSAKQP
jgi:predicted Fe-S protein YdhL (DUF1289 family)